MLSLVRPAARADFAAEASAHLDVLRDLADRQTTIHGEHFKERELWKVRKHKKELVGEPRSFSKCAWCERHREWKRELNVDHYRPKAAVTRWEGSPPLVSDVPPKEVLVSSGYWWLAFEWINYSLACGPCNQGWKRNLFPVREPREPYRVGMEADEVALLLDPMSPFRTADHFSWTDLGIMNAMSERGAATIITCGLNRAELVRLRAGTAGNVLAEIGRLQRALRAATAAEGHLRTLRALCAPESEFAGMNRWWVERTMGWTWDVLLAATAEGPAP
jgi:hypothetical protein